MLLKWRQRHFFKFLTLTGNPFPVPVGLQQVLKQTEILATYNAAMDEVARNIPRRRQLLPSQLVSWEKSSPAQRQFYIKKVVEDCMPVCYCYHNNSLIGAARGTGKRVGLEVCWYKFSEPQYGKDVCDRILSPMKTCIRPFCNEEHDILSAGDMRRALSERPMKGTSAYVCEVDEATITL